jgi:transcriptional regulator GlxA family with amidase domain
LSHASLGCRLNETALTYYPRLQAVVQYVEAHLKDRITLATAAHVAGLEKKYFSAYFHSKVGTPFSKWLRHTRVLLAKDLMGVRELSIPALAFVSGFRDVRTFERTFKKFVGVPPTVYRASVRPSTRITTDESRFSPRLRM